MQFHLNDALAIDAATTAIAALVTTPIAYIAVSCIIGAGTSAAAAGVVGGI